MSKEQFVVITDSEDERFGHVPFVAEHLDVPLTVIDPTPAIVGGRGLSFSIDQAGAECTIAGTPLDRVAAVWDRRPSPLTQDMFSTVDEAGRRYAFDAVQRLRKQLYGQFSRALWVSDRFAVERAELKSLQLAEAARLGFAIPATLLTSDPARAHEFVQNRPATIVKPIAYEGITIDETPLLFFSTRITPDTEMGDYGNLDIGPVIFQEAIDPAYDVRITVAGDQVFAASVTADAEQSAKTGVRDWRIGNHAGNLRIEACDLPAGLPERCVTLVRTLGLQFGAIDMVVDKRGKFWFLEINPNGQWAFVEDATGQPIGKAMARLLLSASLER